MFALRLLLSLAAFPVRAAEEPKPEEKEPLPVTPVAMPGQTELA